MPEKKGIEREFTFTTEDFAFLVEEMIRMEYRLKSHWEFKGDWTRLQFFVERDIKGREATFIFTANYLNSIMHSSYDVVHNIWRIKGTDMGWPLITLGDWAKYFSKPLKRTKNFLVQFLKRAAVNKWRVQHRPNCNCCGQYMTPYQRMKADPVTGEKKRTGQVFWACFNRKYHSDHEPVFHNWDKIGPDKDLPPEIKCYVEKMRARVAAYKKRNKKLGIVRKPMQKIRKPWKVKNSDNLFPSKS